MDSVHVENEICDFIYYAFFFFLLILEQGAHTHALPRPRGARAQDVSTAVTAKPGPSRVKSFGLVTLLGMLCELFISEHHHMHTVSAS